MRLLDCGCGPSSITVDLAEAVAPGEAIGIDPREDALAHGRALARERRIANVTFQAATVYQLPYPDGSFDAAFACAVLQHLAAPLAALKEMRRVLKPGGVIGIVDGSSTITFRYPTNPLLEQWDRLRALERAYNTGRLLGELAIAQGWTTKQELEQMAEALIAWGEAPDAFYARPAFTAVGWA